MQEYLLAFFKSSILLFFLVAMYGIAAPSPYSKTPFSEPESADDLKLNVGGEHTVLEGLGCLSNCTIVGMAYRLDTGKFVYREEHQLLAPAYHEVFYRNSLGEAFAYKLIDSIDYPFAPDFWFLDFRLQQLQAVKRKLEVDAPAAGGNVCLMCMHGKRRLAERAFTIYLLFSGEGKMIVGVKNLLCFNSVRELIYLVKI